MKKLSEYCVKITDGEHGSVPETIGGGYYFLNNNNIREFDIYVNKDDKEISYDTYAKINKRINLEEGDVLISTCGNLGKTLVAQDKHQKYAFSRSVGVIKTDKAKLNPYYLDYYFKLPSSQRIINNRSKGGSQKHFYISDLENFDIKIPSMNKQIDIVNVLRAIDKKMIINNAINDNLSLYLTVI